MRFVIVTGMSGAGKDTALRFLEDMDYFCVGNLPIPLKDSGHGGRTKRQHARGSGTGPLRY